MDDEVQVVEEIFVRTSAIINLRARGHDIRTTAEHPFFVKGKGWICAHEIKQSDELLSHDGQWVTVEAVTDLKEVATVYNLRVSDYHTYFVGSRDWGFSVWAHNANGNYGITLIGNQYVLVNSAGAIVYEAGTQIPVARASRQALEALAVERGILVNPPVRGLTTVGRVRDLQGFERTVADAIEQDGLQVLGAGDNNVRRLLGMPANEVAADLVAATGNNRFRITEVKASTGTGGADVGHALGQLENTVSALKTRVPGATIESLEIAIPIGGRLPPTYALSGDQLVRITANGTEVVRVQGTVVRIRQLAQ